MKKRTLTVKITVSNIPMSNSPKVAFWIISNIPLGVNISILIYITQFYNSIVLALNVNSAIKMQK